MDPRAHQNAELRKKHWAAALAREVLADFAASGMSLTAFARSMVTRCSGLSNFAMFLTAVSRRRWPQSCHGLGLS